MSRLYKILLSVLIIFFYMLDSSCQNKPEPAGDGGGQKRNTFANPDSAAAASIQVLQTLASDDKLKGTVNLTPDETKQLVVAKPIPIQEISYNDLLKAQPDSSLLAQPVDSGLQKKWLYPLQINHVTKTTAIITRSSEAWKLTSAGNNGYVDILSTQLPPGASAISILDVPGLNIVVLHYIADGRAVYIANRNIPEVKIEKGRLLSGPELFQSLVTYARLIEDKNGKDIRNKKIVD